jgi:hypothetical protein
MDNLVIYGVSYFEFLLRASFMWLALLCIVNFYARHDMNWFFMGCFYTLLALNRIWFYNVKIGNWILDNKAHWLESIDKAAPGLMVYDTVSTWVMFLFCGLMFVGFITLLSQMAFRRMACAIAAMGLFTYMIAFGWWMFWTLNRTWEVPYEVIFGYKAALVIFGNILFIIAFSISLKRPKLKDYTYAEAVY